ncbi:hypothetical protein ACEQ8H_003145 [Pleosporales sp. CAS-2024a]
MAPSGSAYTSLESLLLFQCLRAYGVGHNVFARISDLLQKNPDITASHAFHRARLSPDALRAFYLERLRRELEHEQQPDSPDDAANPRKRKKAPSALPTVHESLQHQHLIPQLVNKLYASYRREVVEHIRADEDRHDRLQRELKSIERGEWDHQLRERADGSPPAPRSPTLPPQSPQRAPNPLPPAPSPQPAPNGLAAGSAPEPPQPVLEPKASQSASPAASPRKQRPTTTPPQSSLAQPLAPPPPRLQLSPHQNQQFPPAQQPSAPHNGPLQPGPAQNLPPHPYASNGPSHHAPPHGAPSFYPPGQQRYPHQSPAPQQQQQQRQQYLPPQPPPHHPLQASQYAQPPPQAGFMLPPFQVSPQDPSRVHPPSTVAPQHPQVSTPVSNRQHAQPPRPSIQTPGNGRAGAPPMHPLVNQARHPLSTPINSRSPQSALGTPASAKSLWKKSISMAGTPAVSPRPIPEPIDDFVLLETPKGSPAKSKSQRKSRVKAKGRDKDQDQVNMEEAVPEAESQADDSIVEVETRSGRSRRRAPLKRTRPGSLGSSRAGGSVRDRSRSQSILSHTETVAADNESQAGNRIKSERAASVDAIDEDSVRTPSQMTTRRRGVATRRKRNAREASLEEPEDHFSTPGPQRTIIAPRYFARTCAPIMNDIQSHKHASTFSSAVRAKDAEGYYDIIRRPTDLKTIQKAIGFGAKQVASAASDTPAGSPGGGGGVVELPVIPDNIPPKSIVNAAQLEKELMRMFVNAVMFNPGEDGVVEDAREMFETVQRSVSSWRNVERSSGRTEVEDTPTIDDDEVPSVKRRKVV